MPAQFVLLAVSQLSPETPVVAVSALFDSARRYALSHDITGRMAFDGDGFCHYLEGDEHALLACVDQCQADLRLISFEVVHHGRSNERRYRDFRSGYAYATGEGTSASELLSTQDGDAALKAFLALAPGFDLGR
ncbi:hypothetical protein GN316_11425 [Xylophilus sp. Kf1]|nr:hypothetical protein [Xylophilus sp. Kf1]